VAKKKKKSKPKRVAKKGKKPLKKRVLKRKTLRRSKPAVPRQPKEKLIGKIDHYFDKISVAAIKVKAPFKVGDVLHIKGHTTDFYQHLESMQIDHQNVSRVKPGEDVGIKVKEFVRQNDGVFLADKKTAAAFLAPVKSHLPVVQAPALPAVQPKQEVATIPPAPVSKVIRPQLFQTTIFKKEQKIAAPPIIPPAPPAPKTGGKKDPYSNTKFFKF
jgi:hypothetical protein